VNEWVIVGIVAVVVLFGINKLPQIARNLGKAQNEFKQGLKEGADSDAPAESPKPADKPPTA
jgi:sec-independent protein translocase protein TatA